MFKGQSIADGQVSDEPTAVFSVTTTRAILKSIEVFNAGSSAETIKVFITRNGSARRQIRQALLPASGGQASLLSDGAVWVLSRGDVVEMESTTAAAVDYVIMGATE